MFRTILMLFLFLMILTGIQAGVHESSLSNNPLPVSWSGFVRDLRALRQASSPNPGFSPLRERFVEACNRLESLSKTQQLSADQLADLGALYIRLGKYDKAVDFLRKASRDHHDHFRIQANLGTAWQLHGDLEQASLAIAEAVSLAPKEWKRAETFHLTLLRLRVKEKKDATGLDDLFQLKYLGQSGEPEAGQIDRDQFKKLPADAVAMIQQLLIWLPNDPRLLWQLAELANADGDVNIAANLMDGVIVDYGLKSDDARKRRLVYRSAADALVKQPDHKPHETKITFPSSRIYPRLIDESTLPKIDKSGVNTLTWAVLTETTFGKKFPPKYLDYVNQLDGKKVSVLGFMRPGQESPTHAEFLLTENSVGCWFCESPGPTEVLWVTLEPGKQLEWNRSPMQITGTFKLNKSDPEKYLFVIENATAKKAE